MSEDTELNMQAEELRQLMRDKLGVRGRSFPDALRRGKRLLPRYVRRQGVVVAQALPLADHPKLRQTLDHKKLGAAVSDIRAYLDEIDLANRRKDFIVGMLGSMAFSVLAVMALFVVVLIWRGLI